MRFGIGMFRAGAWVIFSIGCEQAIKVAEYLIEHGKIDGVAVERLFPV